MMMKHQATPRAMTLAELLVALAIVTLLMAGLGSALMIATQALPSRMATQQARLDTSDALDRLESELSCAQFVSEHTATAITFTVADRDGDGNPERIRYAWSGVTGAPITRDYNGQGAQPIVAAASSFALSYDTQASTVSYPGNPVEDAVDTLFGSYWGTNNQQAGSLRTSRWYGQYVQPALPGDALFWRITRFDFSARRNRSGTTDSRAVIYEASGGGLPTGPIMELQPLPSTLIGALVSLLGAYSTFTVNFSLDHHFAAGAGSVVTFQQTTGTDGTIDVSYDSNGGAGMLFGTPTPWTAPSTQSLQYSCYGRITRAGPTTSFDRSYLKCVTLRLGTTADSAVRRIDVPLLNAPELLSAYWELDGARIPTTVNVNGDSSADWTLARGTPLAAPPAGLLRGDAVYAASPDTIFAGYVTIELRFRAITVNQDGDALRLVFERSGGNAKVVTVSATLLNNGSQTFTIFSEARNTLYEKAGLSSDMIDVRLIVDGAIDGVNVSVNGAIGQTAALLNEPLSDSASSLRIGHLTGDVEIDWVRVRKN